MGTGAREVLGDESLPSDHETVSRAALLRGGAARGDAPEVRRKRTRRPVLTDTVVCDTHIPAGTRLILGTVRRPAMSAAARTRTRTVAPRRAAQGARRKVVPGVRAGPRFCPGRNLAFLEAKTALAMIARNFELRLDESARRSRSTSASR